MCQFLGKGNGEFYPELWFNVCESCGDEVFEFYVTLKQISRLERKLTEFETELKGRMQRGKRVKNNDAV